MKTPPAAGMPSTSAWRSSSRTSSVTWAFDLDNGGRIYLPTEDLERFGYTPADPPGTHRRSAVSRR